MTLQIKQIALGIYRAVDDIVQVIDSIPIEEEKVSQLLDLLRDLQGYADMLSSYAIEEE